MCTPPPRSVPVTVANVPLSAEPETIWNVWPGEGVNPPVVVIASVPPTVTRLQAFTSSTCPAPAPHSWIGRVPVPPGEYPPLTVRTPGERPGATVAALTSEWPVFVCTVPIPDNVPPLILTSPVAADAASLLVASVRDVE